MEWSTMKNSNHKGFTLVEVLISMIVLAFMSLAVFKMQVSNSWGVAASDKRTEAIQTATYILDSLKILGLNNISNGATANSSCLTGMTSKTTNVLKCSTFVSVRDSIIDKIGNVQYTSKNIDLVVNWTVSGSTRKYQTETILK